MRRPGPGVLVSLAVLASVIVAVAAVAQQGRAIGHSSDPTFTPATAPIPTYIGTEVSCGGTAVTTCTTAGIAVPANDFILVGVLIGNGIYVSGDPTLTDSVSDTVTSLGYSTGCSGASVAADTDFYEVNSAIGGSSVTFTYNSGQGSSGALTATAMVFTEAYGVAIQAGCGSTAGNPSTVSFSGEQAGQLLLGMFYTNHVITWSGSSSTLVDTFEVGTAAESGVTYDGAGTSDAAGESTTETADNWGVALYGLPPTPTSLAETSKTTTSVSLSWTNALSGLTNDSVKTVLDVSGTCLNNGTRNVTGTHPATTITIGGLHQNTEYCFSVSAQDGAGWSQWSANVIVTTSTDAGPTVSFTYSPSPTYTGEKTTFTPSVSGGATPYSYAWAFGDGSSSSATSPVHQYGASGALTGYLNVTDADGVTVSYSATVTVDINVTFSETGLPAMTTWGVVWGGTPHTTTASSETFTGGSLGAVSWTADTVAGYLVTPTGGSVTLGSAGFDQALVYFPTPTTKIYFNNTTKIYYNNTTKTYYDNTTKYDNTTLYSNKSYWDNTTKVYYDNTTKWSNTTDNFYHNVTYYDNLTVYRNFTGNVSTAFPLGPIIWVTFIVGGFWAAFVIIEWRLRRGRKRKVYTAPFPNRDK
jgi:hypothetical protein